MELEKTVEQRHKDKKKKIKAIKDIKQSRKVYFTEDFVDIVLPLRKIKVIYEATYGLNSDE